VCGSIPSQVLFPNIAPVSSSLLEAVTKDELAAEGGASIGFK